MMISWLNSFSARSRPRAPIRSRSSGFCRRRFIASAKALAAWLFEGRQIGKTLTLLLIPHDRGIMSYLALLLVKIH
jgi:hypothetical protein